MARSVSFCLSKRITECDLLWCELVDANSHVDRWISRPLEVEITELCLFRLGQLEADLENGSCDDESTYEGEEEVLIQHWTSASWLPVPVAWLRLGPGEQCIILWGSSARTSIASCMCSLLPRPFRTGQR